MNRRQTLVAVVICLFVGAILLWVLLHRNATSTALNNDPQILPTNTTLAVLKQSNGQRPHRFPQSNSVDRADLIRYRLRAIQMDPDWDSKRSIAFFGRVLDLDGSPVQDARVDFNWSDAGGNGIQAVRVTTVDGKFSLTGERGKRIQVRVSKDGYYAVIRSNRISFEYANAAEATYHEPRSDEPVSFFLKKKGKGETLLTSASGMRSGMTVRPPTNGDPIYVDVINRRVGTSGQVAIQKLWEPKSLETGRNNWRFSIAVPEGGLIEHDEEFPFTAPETGYKPGYEWNFESSGTNWQATLSKYYFIKFGDPPRYGRINLRTSAFGTGVNLEYAVNPTGFRNLEEAPKAPLPPGTILE